jgi:hypothetical protein
LTAVRSSARSRAWMRLVASSCWRCLTTQQLRSHQYGRLAPVLLGLDEGPPPGAVRTRAGEGPTADAASGPAEYRPTDSTWTLITGDRGSQAVQAPLRSVRAGSGPQRSNMGMGGHQRSPTVRRNRRSRALRLRQLGLRRREVQIVVPTVRKLRSLREGGRRRP